MNPFAWLDDLLGPLDAVSVAAGTAKMLAHGHVAADRIAIRRPWQKTAIAVLLGEGIDTYSDTYDGDWWYYRVAAGDGKRAIQLLDDYGIDAAITSQIDGEVRP